MSDVQVFPGAFALFALFAVFAWPVMVGLAALIAGWLRPPMGSARVGVFSWVYSRSRC